MGRGSGQVPLQCDQTAPDGSRAPLAAVRSSAGRRHLYGPARSQLSYSTLPKPPGTQLFSPVRSCDTWRGQIPRAGAAGGPAPAGRLTGTARGLLWGRSPASISASSPGIGEQLALWVLVRPPPRLSCPPLKVLVSCQVRQRLPEGDSPLRPRWPTKELWRLSQSPWR